MGVQEGFMTRQSGYYRFPSINQNTITFVSEDDLWCVSAEGGKATRLTSNLALTTRPYVSPDGEWIAFTSLEEGSPEIYAMPAQGGVARRLTFTGATCLTIGWTPEGKSILFISNQEQPFSHMFYIYQIPVTGGRVEKLPYGVAHHIAFGKKGVVLGRNTMDSARWKRYKGGTCGVLWVDAQGKGQFKKMKSLGGNIDTPMWVGDRIYFLSDHEGRGSLYSCTPNGQNLKKHFGHSEFYLRNAQTDGKRVVFQAGGELWCYDISSGDCKAVDIEWHSPRVECNRKFASTSKYLEDFSLHPEGHSILMSSRGKLFSFGNWEGAVLPLNPIDVGRYRLSKWLYNKKHIVTVSDHGGEERLERHRIGGKGKILKLSDLDLGRIVDLHVSPKSSKVIVTNHRHELILVDLKKQVSTILDKSDYHPIEGFSWSPDGKWVTYGFAETQKSCSIKLCNIKTKETHRLTSKRFIDISPSFDPQGKFIYFISYRVFNPVYDHLFFDLNFPKGARPFLIALSKDTESPFVTHPKPLQNISNKNRRSNSTQDDMVIDLDGIENRVQAFPIPEGTYLKVYGLKNKVLYMSRVNEGVLGEGSRSSASSKKRTLHAYDFSKQKSEVVATGVSDFDVSLENETLIYRSGHRLRVMLVGAKDDKKQNSHDCNRETGWIDLSRSKVSINPVDEWRQMYREIWRLQRENFWTEDMSSVDWNKVYQRYYPLLYKIATRTEFSDLIGEMQGELGTSHAYEMGGDYKPGPRHMVGNIGADLSYDDKAELYQFTNIVQGDAWSKNDDSPLNRLGANINSGDYLLAINGEPIGKNKSPGELLVNMAKSEVVLKVCDSEQKSPRDVTIQTLSSDTQARYREWVENNRKIVEEATKGKVGYVHIPDMGPTGYAEFHRYYLTEVEREALIVDVRNNGGGHVSQLILEKLVRTRVGYAVSRWGQPETYPDDLIEGPMVALTNEYAGSDGDIFSHSFKLLKLGTLIGTRTWGGVIGISPRHALVDRTITTQPEYSFWFDDVEWGVENYGTDPDIEVEIAPQDWKAGKDPQLKKGIEVILKELKKRPVEKKKFDKRPKLDLPT